MSDISAGDIVERNGARFVVISFRGGPTGQYAVIRNAARTDAVPLSALTVVERPVYAHGEPVLVNGVRGSVEALTGDGHAHVLMPAHRRPLTADPRYGIQIPDTISRVPLGQLTLENRL